MKPKKRSNVVWSTLLFLLIVAPGYSIRFESDTLIVDGETIYIVRDTIGNMDSLENAAREDVKKKPLSIHRFGIAIHGGYNATIAAFGTSQNEFVPINNYVGDNHTVAFNPTASIELSGKFWQFPALSGQMSLEAIAGVSYNQVRVKCDVVERDSLNRDSILFFNYSGDEFFLQYFEPFEPGGNIGEVDTSIFPVQKKILKYPTFDIPIKVRVNYNPNKSQSSFYFEAGVVKRIVLDDSGIDVDNFLINDRGEHIVVSGSEFKPRELLRPVFGIGAERRFQPDAEGSSAFFSSGAQLNVQIPRTSANTSSLFYTDISSISLSVFLKVNF